MDEIMVKDQTAFERFIEEAVKYGHPIRSLEELEQSDEALCTYLNDAKEILQSQVELDPKPILPFCSDMFEWMSDNNPAHMVKDTHSPSGVNLIFECMGIDIIDDVFRQYTVYQTVESVEQIYNFHIDTLPGTINDDSSRVHLSRLIEICCRELCETLTMIGLEDYEVWDTSMEED